MRYREVYVETDCFLSICPTIVATFSWCRADAALTSRPTERDLPTMIEKLQSLTDGADTGSIKRRVATIIVAFVVTSAVERYFDTDPDTSHRTYLKAVLGTAASGAIAGVVTVVASAALAVVAVAAALAVMAAVASLAAKLRSSDRLPDVEYDSDDTLSEPSVNVGVDGDPAQSTDAND